MEALKIKKINRTSEKKTQNPKQTNKPPTLPPPKKKVDLTARSSKINSADSCSVLFTA